MGLMLGLQSMYHENVVQKFLVPSTNILLTFEQKDLFYITCYCQKSLLKKVIFKNDKRVEHFFLQENQYTDTEELLLQYYFLGVGQRTVSYDIRFLLVLQS